MLPAFLVTASGLWRGAPFALVIGGAALAFIILMGLAVIAIFAAAFLAGEVTPTGPAALFGVVVATSAVVLGFFLARIEG